LTARADLVSFTQSLAAAGSLEQLERAFMAGFPSIVPARLYGYSLSEPVAWHARASVTEPSIEDVVAVPLTVSGRICGELHFGDSEREYGPDEVALATAIGAVIAHTVEGLAARRDLERERDHALAALELAGTPVVTTTPEPRLNDAARRLLGEIVDGDRRLHELLGRSGIDVGVELTGGEAAILSGHARRQADGGLVVVLELERQQPGLAAGPLAALTPREQEVAVLVVDGLADREIAERLCLSPHTVTQYVKRIYRKIDVDSRVRLTRVLLGSGRR
jgi:DNA-binding CsgD family transcriptional regulator